MQQRTVPLPITLALLVAAVVGVGALMKAKEVTQIVPDFPETAEAAEEVTSTFVTVTADAWHYTVMAERAIQELGEGQRVMDGIVVDPTDGAIAYFATSAFDATTKTMTVSIYRYDMQALTFTRLYQMAYEEGQSRALGDDTWPVLHVVGYDRGRVVVRMTDVNGIAAGARFSLSLTDPSAGLTAYTTRK